MKIAFVHDWIITIGGAEKVFIDLIKEEKYSQGEIFCVFSDKNFLSINGQDIKINSVIKNNFLINKIGYRNLMPIFPILNYFLSKKIKKYNPDKLLISSFAIAKNIKSKVYKKIYLHSPMQYIRDSYEEYLEKLFGIKKLIFKISSKFLRKWDKKYFQFDEVYFNSKYTEKLAQKIYGIKGIVKYPKINNEIVNTNIVNQKDNYYIYIGRLVRFSKELDKIIELFNNLDDNLLIVGAGPDELLLKSKVKKSNIIFLGEINNLQKKIKLLKKSKGLINITKESFGIVTAESLSLGVPVFAYNCGASPELLDLRSGVLIHKKNQYELKNKFEEFKKIKFDYQEIKNNFLSKLDKYL
ncbi:glycosyltransferase [Candidatus Vampirococcus lugosii]|uniref:Group 1 glycosyl transferase n=1 Tax=Candidatus Vampirococcus lugosii TaxID=2789015 RepID=A0ABS5QQU6_9BACT|nr:glycosyltransferase [Candidatus Vampirococcus lugosii]MBS8122524.1 group 1 glycosyl transferase [Candidatus Vampirococcus lugosii]